MCTRQSGKKKKMELQSEQDEEKMCSVIDWKDGEGEWLKMLACIEHVLPSKANVSEQL